MLLKLLGWIWILSGVLFLFKPELMRDKFKKQSVKKLKKIFFGLAFGFSVLLVNAAWGIPGLLAKIVLIFGLLGIAKAFFILKAKAADALIEWYVAQPVKFFRASAAGLVVMGAIILTV